MPLIFCLRPATRNIGNDLINHATHRLISAGFENQAMIVNIPALADRRFGGITAAQVYDINRLGDGLVIGGGNLFENGQITIDAAALAALHVPVLVIGCSHGRIFDRHGVLVARSDSLGVAPLRQLAGKACGFLLRDQASADLVRAAGIDTAEVAGCPSLFLPANLAPPNLAPPNLAPPNLAPPNLAPPNLAPPNLPPPNLALPNLARPGPGGRILLSVRHPERMSIPPVLQWRIADDVRRMIAALQARFGPVVSLLCHDYADISFAAAFPGVPLIYYETVEPYIATLRAAFLSITYRLHAFLPCVAFGVPSIHLSYDERGQAMVETIGMAGWNVDSLSTADCVGAVMALAENPADFCVQRLAAQPRITALAARSAAAVQHFASQVEHGMRTHGGAAGHG